MPPNELLQLRLIDKPSPESTTIKVLIKERPRLNWCKYCAKHHKGKDCYLPNKEKMCANKGCTALHDISQCPSPIQCRICTMKHDFHRCSLYRGKLVPLEIFVQKRMPLSPAASTVVSPSM